MNSKKRNFLPYIFIFLLIASVLSFIWIEQSTRTDSYIVTSTPSLTPEPKFEVTIPSKGLLKNYVTVSVKAETGTSCNLIFIPASGETLNMDTVADENGDCAWRWKLEESYKKGTARLIFTINGMSETHFLQILESF